MGMGAPIGSQGGMPPQQKPGVPMPAQGKGQPGVQQPNRPGPMPAQGKGQPMPAQGKGQPNLPQALPPQGKGQPMPAQGKGQPMQPQGPYGQRPEDMYKGKDFNKGQDLYGRPRPGQLPQPGQLPDYALPYAPALRAQVQPQIGAPPPNQSGGIPLPPGAVQGLGQVPANQGLGSIAQTLGYTPYTNAQYAAIQKANPGMAIG